MGIGNNWSTDHGAEDDMATYDGYCRHLYGDDAVADDGAAYDVFADDGIVYNAAAGSGHC